jgi:AAA15 family ATPase/GTPase
MLLCIKNLGKIKAADIEINGITVIAGENNTGKSTVGKTLYCVFNSFYNIDNEIEAERLRFMSRTISYINRSRIRINADELANSIFANKNMYVNNPHSLYQYIESFCIQSSPNTKQPIENEMLDNIVKSIIYVLNTSDDEMLAIILRRKMQAEFNMQINNLHDTARISKIMLRIQETEVKIQVKNNEYIDIKKNDNTSPNTEVIYIDDPYAMDNLRFTTPEIPPHSSLFNHREHLIMKFVSRKKTSVIDEIIVSKKLIRVLEKLNSVCPGEMMNKNDHSFAYEEKGAGISIDITNVSTGLKTFAIIKTLLLDGCLEENGTIILDEPEIHLHPEWQLIFAELIVLIQKEFNMYILLNTHSPYFLDAIEVYSQKHGIASKCKYYLAEASGTMSVITDVSMNLERIYAKLAGPLQVLENERYSDD